MQITFDTNYLSAIDIAILGLIANRNSALGDIAANLPKTEPVQGSLAGLNADKVLDKVAETVNDDAERAAAEAAKKAEAEAAAAKKKAEAAAKKAAKEAEAAAKKAAEEAAAAAAMAEKPENDTGFTEDEGDFGEDKPVTQADVLKVLNEIKAKSGMEVAKGILGGRKLADIPEDELAAVLAAGNKLLA